MLSEENTLCLGSLILWDSAAQAVFSPHCVHFPLLTAGHLRRVFRGADPESPEPTADSSLAPSAPGEEAKEEQNDHKPPAVVTPQPEHSEPVVLEKEQEQIDLSEGQCQTEGELLPAREQEEQLGQQVEEALENGQNIKAEPQAELPEAQSAIVAVKGRHQEDMRSTEEEMRLHQQRGDQQNRVSERVAATPLIKLSLSSALQNFKEKLQAELQEARARIEAREKRLEEGMKIIKEKTNHLIEEMEVLDNQVGVLTSHLAASEGFQQMTGDEETQGRHEAQQLSQAEILKVERVSKMVEEKWTQWEEIYTGSSIESAASSSSSSSAAAAADSSSSSSSII
ncbi:uncharacterized protein DDB_G0290301-like [Cyanistes caeruleus]|uniref:uncharacterized protein DDB_G0290301-like n=1 Tax=Cyanistes caeruleus TaxID=156563 RepID=UPI000CDB1EAC|nr:uncharacterized protein DDB_G0290301-like [Cyanistes caeruleus]